MMFNTVTTRKIVFLANHEETSIAYCFKPKGNIISHKL